MKILSSSYKKEILKKLTAQFGITKLPYLLVKFGQDKIKVYSGNLLKDELRILDNNVRIEDLGLYSIKEEPDGLRLTSDALYLFEDQITKNILELNDEQAMDWFRGNELAIKTERGYKVLKYKNELIGCGRSSGEKISNFLSKERRIKN